MQQEKVFNTRRISIRTTRTKIKLTTTVFFIISGIITATWASRIPDMQQRFQVNDAAWGAILFTISAGLFAGLAVSSWLVEKFGSSRIMTISSIAFSSLLVLLSVAPSVPVLVVMLFIFGMLRNLTNLSINTNSIEVQRHFPNPIIARFHGVWSIACFVGAAVGSLFISQRINVSWHFLPVAAACIIAIIISRRKRSRKNGIVTGKRPFFIKPDKYLFMLGLVCLSVMICESTMFDWSVNYYIKVVHADHQYQTFGYTAFIISMAAGRFVGDYLISKYGPLRMLMINGGIITMGYITSAVFSGLIGATIGFLLVGAGVSIIVPLVYMLAGKTTKMPANYAIASVTLIGYFGFLTGPLLVGSVTELLGMRVAFAVIACFGLFVSFFAFLIHKHLQKKNIISSH